MNKRKKKVKIFEFGRRVGRIKNLEAAIEEINARMDWLVEFYPNGVSKQLTDLYEQIESIRKEIDKIEEDVVEIHIRF